MTKKISRKVLPMLAVMALAFALAGCGGSGSPASNGGGTGGGGTGTGGGGNNGGGVVCACTLCAGNPACCIDEATPAGAPCACGTSPNRCAM